MNVNDIPKDSVLRDWVAYLSTTEVPLSYQVVGALSALGVVVRRSRWIDQLDWRVYPNQSVMFIGPSGVGKDTIINRVQSTISRIEWLSHVPTIGGVTLENIYARLAALPVPAAAYMSAPEMTAFFGKADYQQNLLTGVTDLLSNKDKIDITTKGQFMLSGEKFIHQPTVTMHAGSTVEWLHKAMPSGTMEGGFLGRFLIISEEFSGRYVPLVKQDMDKEQITRLRAHLGSWNEHMERTIRAVTRPAEVIIYTEAEDLYSNWYRNRFKYFSKVVTPYANRSRDTVLRLAMLMAFSRGHYRWVEAEDVQFAIDLMHLVAKRIDEVARPASPEAQVSKEILTLLPATIGEIYVTLGITYTVKLIESALQLLRVSGKVVLDRNGAIRPSGVTANED